MRKREKRMLARRTILVIDQWTNGHEAALHFIRQEGWKRRECNLVFCGNHNVLLQKLAEGPAYAVVPVFNSGTQSQIKSVTHEIAKYREMGYHFEVLTTLDLQIKHYLMAKKRFKIADLQQIISKSEPIAQCYTWLHNNGFKESSGKLAYRDSTGAAAAEVSKSNPRKEKIAAIAPKAAAHAYGLKILANGKNLSDDPNNRTTFELLKNEAVPQKCIVGIIGIGGGFGQFLKVFFEKLGFTVIGSDRFKPTGLTNAEIVRQAEVVIFAVPIRQTVAVIKSVLKYTSDGQLLMDVTSVKSGAIQAMLKGRAQVVGLHPMHAPGIPFEGQTIVVCRARLDIQFWKTWVVNFLSATGAKRKWSSAGVHDEYMLTVQVNPQEANFASAVLMMEMGVDVAESLTFTSPFYKLMFSLMGRMLSQDPELYASIFMENSGTLRMLKKRREIDAKLIRIIKKKDYRAFKRLHKKVKEHFGPEVIEEANRLFIKFNTVNRTSGGPNSITLQFSAKDNRPGLLEKVARVFRRHNVNLTGITSVSFGADQNQFSITTAEPRRSERVLHVLSVIQRWKRPCVQVVPNT